MGGCALTAASELCAGGRKEEENPEKTAGQAGYTSLAAFALPGCSSQIGHRVARFRSFSRLAVVRGGRYQPVVGRSRAKRKPNIIPPKLVRVGIQRGVRQGKSVGLNVRAAMLEILTTVICGDRCTVGASSRRGEKRERKKEKKPWLRYLLLFCVGIRTGIPGDEAECAVERFFV